MKIEKIKNFNQIILAIAGILGIVLLLVFIGIGVSELFRGVDTNTPMITNSLISDEQIETLEQDNLRLQVISYDTPRLIDTLNSVYIIPISVSTLDRPEKIVEESDELLMLMDTRSSAKMRGYYRENYFEDLFANLVVYQPAQNKSVLLFNERIVLSRPFPHYFDDDILLVFFTVEKDTDQDGLINFKDDKKLCIYSLKTDKMRQISYDKNSITDYQFIGESKDLLVEFELSLYENVEFRSHKPRKVMKYDFANEKLSEVVPNQIQKQMQTLVQGTID
jgi:hypothetical protein